MGKRWPIPFSQADIQRQDDTIHERVQERVEISLHRYEFDKGTGGSKGMGTGYAVDNGSLAHISDYTLGSLQANQYTTDILRKISKQLSNISASLENISYQLGSRPADPGQASRQNERATSPSDFGRDSRPDAGRNQQGSSSRGDSVYARRTRRRR